MVGPNKTNVSIHQLPNVNEASPPRPSKKPDQERDETDSSEKSKERASATRASGTVLGPCLPWGSDTAKMMRRGLVKNNQEAHVNSDGRFTGIILNPISSKVAPSIDLKNLNAPVRPRQLQARTATPYTVDCHPRPGAKPKSAPKGSWINLRPKKKLFNPVMGEGNTFTTVPAQ